MTILPRISAWLNEPLPGKSAPDRVDRWFQRTFPRLWAYFSEGAEGYAPSLGDVIRETRRRKGRTQAELAIMAGLSERTIRNIERGASESPESLRSACAALDIPLPELQERRRPRWVWGVLHAAQLFLILSGPLGWTLLISVVAWGRPWFKWGVAVTSGLFLGMIGSLIAVFKPIYDAHPGHQAYHIAMLQLISLSAIALVLAAIMSGILLKKAWMAYDIGRATIMTAGAFVVMNASYVPLNMTYERHSEHLLEQEFKLVEIGQMSLENRIRKSLDPNHDEIEADRKIIKGLREVAGLPIDPSFETREAFAAKQEQVKRELEEKLRDAKNTARPQNRN